MFSSTDVRERAELRRGQPTPGPSVGMGHAAVTVRLEAGSPIRVQQRPGGGRREIIAVDPGQAAGDVEIHLEAGRRDTHSLERMLEASRRDARSVERMLDRLRVSGTYLPNPTSDMT